MNAGATIWRRGIIVATLRFHTVEAAKAYVQNFNAINADARRALLTY